MLRINGAGSSPGSAMLFIYACTAVTQPKVLRNLDLSSKKQIQVKNKFIFVPSMLTVKIFYIIKEVGHVDLLRHLIPSRSRGTGLKRTTYCGSCFHPWQFKWFR